MSNGFVTTAMHSRKASKNAIVLLTTDRTDVTGQIAGSASSPARTSATTKCGAVVRLRLSVSNRADSLSSRNVRASGVEVATREHRRRERRRHGLEDGVDPVRG